jgi:N,N'-diacetyllegionaminate synthase
MKCEIVAECGVSHGGGLDAALMLVEKAKEADADIVKFQTYRPDKLVRRDDPSYELLAKLALPFCAFRKIAAHCEAVGIEFMSTPGDVDSLKFLVEECGVRRIKIGSDDLTHKPLVFAAFETGLPVILSTGMATLGEVWMAVRTGHLNEANALGRNFTLLHCVSIYPTPPELANLAAIEELTYQFKRPAGYSDHTQGTMACLAAAAMGACMVEKHLMLAESTKPVDHDVSIMPARFREMVRQIRLIEVMRGHGLKDPSPEERAMAAKLRKDASGLRPLAKDTGFIDRR